MKTTLSIIFIMATIIAHGQEFRQGGKIRYKETITLKMDFSTDDPRMAELSEMMPSTRESEKELLFEEAISLYRNAPEEKTEKTQMVEEEGLSFTFDFQTPQNIIYNDFSKGKMIRQQSFMGRTFLIDGQIERRWKISNDQKEIMGYNCRKAILDDSTEVIAWYTPEIAAFTGPETYHGLPGLILELEMKNRTITAIEMTEGVSERIEAPKKGKKVSPKQFSKIMEDKMKELQNEYGGKGSDNVIIIRSDQ